MKKITLALVVGLLLLPLQAMAISLYFDTCGLTDDPTGCGQTSLFDEIAFYAETTVTQFGDSLPPEVGDSFDDSGSLNATGFVFTSNTPATTNGRLLNATWQLTGLLSGYGYVTEVSTDGTDTRIAYSYTGGTLDLYAARTATDINDILDGGFTLYDYATRAATDDVNFDLGDKIGSFSLVYGIGYTFLDFGGGDVENQGSGEFLLSATELMPGFWFDANGNDLSELANINWFINFTDYNVDDPILLPYINGLNSNGAAALPLFDLQVTHDGSMEFAVVPEPSTFLLLGGGLLGLGFLGYRRKRNS